jgi:hypothetical protein
MIGGKFNELQQTRQRVTGPPQVMVRRNLSRRAKDAGIKSWSAIVNANMSAVRETKGSMRIPATTRPEADCAKDCKSKGSGACR